ncbi:hypothetical protein CSHISOI_03541 [Colletotrichum shisoi]|uniref:ATP-grasp domain-containing protein n=1 Tax=Colletotrichum shisoi TaxID=2078593 RepID=A0A5Q4BY30_9PEZI|nr:hypothetical protein CSHISOI_03541 [Colletotrichum shisoi]
MAPASRDPFGQILKNLALIALSLAFLPLNTVLLFACYAWQHLRPGRASGTPGAPGTADQRQPLRRRTILVTGVGMTKGLTLARLFHQAGHRVVGADFSPHACGSRSRALSAYHVLQKPGRGSADPYLDSVLRVVEQEKVDLWVSCSGVGSAVEDGIVKEVLEARTGCRAVQFDVARTQVLHEKDSFMEHTRETGLRVPESYLVTSRNEMIAALDGAAAGLSYDSEGEAAKPPRARRPRFIAKSVGLNDRGRGDMTLLPLPTEKQTYDHIYRLEWLGLSDKEPWLLQEFIDGHEFCTHSLVVRGRVRAFVACRSAELLMHYVALPPESSLSLAMLEFTRKQAASFGESFTGHLSFDFMVTDTDVAVAKMSSPEQLALYPIECNPRAHTAVALFGDTPDLVQQYLAVLDDDDDDADDDNDDDKSGAGLGVEVVTPRKPTKYYWIGHDLLTLLLLPTAQLLLFRTSLAAYGRSVKTFAEHILFWKDGTFEPWDPLPAWWLYHVYWPSVFWNCIVNWRCWSRINVSTTKMFECD